jgi:hypothetical protein
MADSCTSTCSFGGEKTLAYHDGKTNYGDFVAYCKSLGGNPRSWGNGVKCGAHINEAICNGQYETVYGQGYGYGSNLAEARAEARKSCYDSLSALYGFGGTYGGCDVGGYYNNSGFYISDGTYDCN